MIFANTKSMNIITLIFKSQNYKIVICDFIPPKQYLKLKAQFYYKYEDSSLTNNIFCFYCNDMFFKGKIIIHSYIIPNV